jgi:3-hydroxybutyryl-CoA dehydratase
MAQTFTKDFDELEVGERFTTEERAIAMTDVMAFAELTGDTHPQHTDAEWARDSLFGEQIAHGLLVLSAAAGLVPFDPDRVMALRRIGDCVFKRPVRFGDTVHVSGKVTDLKAVDDAAGLVTLAWTVANQAGQAVCRARVEVLWRRDGEPAGEPGDDGGFVPIPL